MQKLMSDLWPNESLHQVYLCKHVLEESVNFTRFIVTAQLWQEPTIVFYVSTTILGNNTFSHPCTVCIEIS